MDLVCSDPTFAWLVLTDEERASVNSTGKRPLEKQQKYRLKSRAFLLVY